MGKNEDNEFKPNFYKVSKNLVGNCGLFYSNKDPKSIVNYFKDYSVPNYATPGLEATETIILKKGQPKEL